MKHDEMMNTILDVVYDRTDPTLAHNNANKDSRRIPTMRDMVAGEVSKTYALEHILPKHVADAHKDGDIHFHDLDYSPLFPMFNCMLIDLENMLSGGFKMGAAQIETPRSITTACSVTAQIIAQVASHIYGGNSINRIDEALAPYVRKSYSKWLSNGRQYIENESKAVIYAEKMTRKETYDAFQSLEYEINTLHTANGQPPFTTLGFGLGESWEARLIQESIFKVRLEGLGKDKTTAIFPKLVFTIKDGLNRNPDDKNYKMKRLALKCAAHRMYPDILNYDKVVEVTGSFKAPMGCRSFLDLYEEDGKQIHDGRNNMGVVSVNIPRIAIEAEGDVDEFFAILEDRMLYVV